MNRLRTCLAALTLLPPVVPDSTAAGHDRRADMRLYAAEVTDIPDVQVKGLFVIVNALPDGAGLEVTAINFAGQAVDEAVRIPGAAAGVQAIDALNPGRLGPKSARMAPCGCT